MADESVISPSEIRFNFRCNLDSRHLDELGKVLQRLREKREDAFYNTMEFSKDDACKAVEMMDLIFRSLSAFTKRSI